MKDPELKVSIPKPCHENWNNMTPTEKGKFCGVCTKEVVDFAADSDEEIITYFSNHRNICGRFHVSQLDRKLIADRKKRNHWLSYAASFLLPMALFSQEKPQKTGKVSKIETIDISNFKSLHISSLQRKGTTNTTLQNERFTVTVIVTDDAGLPLPGATVLIKGTGIGKTTDFDGKYQLDVKAGDILVISYVGFASKEIKINENRREYNALLEYDDTIGMMVGMVCFSEPEGADEYGYVSKYDTTSYPKPMTEEEIKERDERTKKYFTLQKKKWREKRERKRAERARRKAEKKDDSKK
ncbi:carboxypeptidase-like regulatory domain-containing protein [Kordia sp. YSTF-M3]|uniref:Carboxypeptidase-like regulatory domain-containing protein n=1 Tax=Kordia aestuariivivens TaxID=2759037 RepID=A0ABR7QCF3_9FLAO|nr:carboxypeptidase-like regulatory domain-containing protein [Kordia aestuariivivens]MBC8756230.1 carboxypeptidase-like regulatory domain-containing protein [Kordia aestuariivivens]